MLNNHNSFVPFFFDNSLTKNFRIFGQILYIYFDPTFRRYVSVIDVGLKQKASIFVDDIFRGRSFYLNNNFQFLLSKKRDIFSLRPVHFSSSKNERALKRKYLFSSSYTLRPLKLNNFSFLAVKYFTAKNEKLFNFKGSVVFDFVLLKSLGFNRFLSTHKLYSLVALSVLKRSRPLSYKAYECLKSFVFLRVLLVGLVTTYRSLLYLFYLRGSGLSSFFS